MLEPFLKMELDIKSIFFPFENIKSQDSISNVLRMTNYAPYPVSFKIKTTHPKDITAQPSGGTVPAGQSTDIILGWDSEKIVTGPRDYSQLVPPRQPKISVEQFINSANGGNEALASIKLPVNFVTPGDKDRYTLVVNGRVQSTFGKTPGKLTPTRGNSTEFRSSEDGKMKHDVLDTLRRHPSFRQESASDKNVVDAQEGPTKRREDASEKTPPLTTFTPSNSAATKECSCFLQ
eukprot:TRINITY_DN2606_c0_g1_i1.p1 TRINITY_DN2606_c0_g1~~TRINITY_DN2606_c0_g1_i1.p1  ORF type:complete len:234 (-),score=2.01 TRINITY_DN2606_c0_g1_i1:129-830(-)